MGNKPSIAESVPNLSRGAGKSQYLGDSGSHGTVQNKIILKMS
jgi:hypothetical protein